MKSMARILRSNMTKPEQILWHYIRRKQIQNIQFYRQKILGPYIVDFYAPHIRLVIELDGHQHHEKNHKAKDENRDHYLSSANIKVIRINNDDIKAHLHDVLTYISKIVAELNSKIPSPAYGCRSPLTSKGTQTNTVLHQHNIKK